MSRPARRLRPSFVALPMLTLALALPAMASASSPPPASSGVAARETVVSNETTFTTWTVAVDRAVVRTRASSSARRVTRLRLWTSDGFPQVYVVLSVRSTRSGKWVQLRLPMRPNGRTGWVPSRHLDDLRVVHTEIVIDRASHRLTLNRNGKQLLQVPVGVGKPSTPTPAGHFWITEKFAVHGVPLYGPFAFGTSAYSKLTDWPGGGVVGIHGTNEPGLVPGAPSHGCVRVHNADIKRLSRLVPVGTPVRIT
jgi:lipoprotein-anchoring transpeptidase ErfK/SrfK